MYTLGSGLDRSTPQCHICSPASCAAKRRREQAVWCSIPSLAVFSHLWIFRQRPAIKQRVPSGHLHSMSRLST